MRWILAAALVAWAGVAGAQEAAAPAFQAAGPTNAPWRVSQEPGANRLVRLKGPEKEDDAKYFPKGAPATGLVLIRCTVTDKGTVTDCALVKEDPEGSGLAAVALQEVNLFRFQTKDRDGKPIAGQKIILAQNYLAAGDQNPDWLNKPTPATLLAVYPRRALIEKKSGSANIRCTVTVEGFLDGCKVLRETPAGYGFGESALLLSSQFLMTPKMRGGKLVEGDVTIPVNWEGLEYVTSAPGKTVLRDPPWSATPSAAAVKAAYPAKATAAGQATLRCKLKPDGHVNGCTISSQIPSNMGFGPAANALIGAFVVAVAPGEQAPKDSLVEIPFRFRNPATPDNGRLTDPHWITPLSPEAAIQLFPPAARAAGLKDGTGVVDCLATAEGRLADCKVTREAPEKLGFGAAALEAAKAMQMNRWSTGGDPVEGRRLAVPIRFKLDAPAEAAKP